MSRYKMDDGTFVDTKKAKEHWNESTRWDGANHISVATGSQWEHETLYLSAKGRWYIEYTSQWQGTASYAVYVSEEEAAGWIFEHRPDDLPDNLKQYVTDLTE